MIYLRPFETEDYKLINKWRNDKELQKLTGAIYSYISAETDKNWVAEKMKFSVKELYVAICLKATNEMVGYTSLNEIDPIHKRCVWGGIVIGSEAGRGKNIAFQAGFEILEYAFLSLNMNRISGSYFDTNSKSAKLCSKLNFKVEGVFRNSLYKHGRFHNEVWVGLLREEFEQLKQDNNSASAQSLTFD